MERVEKISPQEKSLYEGERTRGAMHNQGWREIEKGVKGARSKQISGGRPNRRQRKGCQPIKVKKNSAEKGKKVGR